MHKPVPGRAAGIPPMVQVNASHSAPGVVRGLHFQHPGGQGKLVSVLDGAIYDVAVDVRRGSPTFGHHVGVELSSENGRQFYIPPGFAHGFCVTSPGGALVLYGCTSVYAPGHEFVVRWDDPVLGIEWPLAASPVLSPRDADAKVLLAQILVDADHKKLARKLLDEALAIAPSHAEAKRLLKKFRWPF